MAEHTYEWYPHGDWQEDDALGKLYAVYNVFICIDGAECYANARDLMKVDAQEMLHTAVRWKGAVERLGECLARTKVVSGALDESWEGASSQRARHYLDEINTHLVYAGEIIEPPTAYLECLAKIINEFKQQYKLYTYSFATKTAEGWPITHTGEIVIER